MSKDKKKDDFIIDETGYVPKEVLLKVRKQREQKERRKRDEMDNR